MSMMSTLIRFSAIAVVAIGILYKLVLEKDLYERFGVNRPIEAINNQNCDYIHELDSCEDAWLHQPSGYLYLTCSRVTNRYKWLPNADHLDTTQVPEDEYLAVVDTKGTGPWKSRIKKVIPQNFPGHDGKGSLLLHGMGVYLPEPPTTTTSFETTPLRFFLINHRPQLHASTLGANSTIEIFESTLNSPQMTHIKTFHDPEIIFTPNNLVPAGPDSFYFCNDHSVKTGHFLKILDFFFAGSHLGFCDGNGCRHATSKLKYPNGLAGASNHPIYDSKIVYKASSAEPVIQVFRIQDDQSLKLIEEIHTGYLMDNINVASDGSLIVAAFPKIMAVSGLLKKYSPETKVPSVTLRVSRSEGETQADGKGWKVEKLFEDDGRVMSAATNAVFDTERRLLFLSGMFTPHVAVCRVSSI